MLFGFVENSVGQVDIVSVIGLQKCEFNRLVRVFFKKILQKQAVAQTL